MADPVTWYAVGGLVLSGVSAGVSYYGGQQQAKAQAAMADYNARVQSQNAAIKLQLAKFEADANERVARANEAALRNNAISLRRFAEAQTAAARENERRTRRDNLRLRALQRARVAKAGVLSSGTPVEVFAETAGQMESAIAEMHYQSEIQRRQTLMEADNMQFQAGLAGFDASMQRFRGAAAQAGHKIDLRNIEVARLSGLNQAKGTATAATASLLSGLSSTATSYAGMKYQGIV